MYSVCTFLYSVCVCTYYCGIFNTLKCATCTVSQLGRGPATLRHTCVNWWYTAYSYVCLRINSKSRIPQDHDQLYVHVYTQKQRFPAFLYYSIFHPEHILWCTWYVLVCTWYVLLENMLYCWCPHIYQVCTCTCHVMYKSEKWALHYRISRRHTAFYTR